MCALAIQTGPSMGVHLSVEPLAWRPLAANPGSHVEQQRTSNDGPKSIICFDVPQSCVVGTPACDHQSDEAWGPAPHWGPIGGRCAAPDRPKPAFGGRNGRSTGQTRPTVTERRPNPLGTNTH